jgi:scyllo-inositol 2-dehydrogenase (NADP+)
VTATGPDVRTAVIGYGLAGEVFHAPLIAATPGMRLATVVTSNAERQQRARRDHPGVRIVERVDDVWHSSADHDLVVVATPNRQHVPIASAALAAGLDVVVDKPMAPTSAQARELIEAARRQQRLLTVFHNRRWDSEILTLQRLLAEERLGRVVRVESRFERWRPQVTERWRESTDPEDAGGLLFDLGTHLIDQALHLFGSPQRVYAEIGCRRPGAAVDDDVFLALGFADSLDVHLWMSMVAAGGAPRLRVLGLRGTFVRQRLDVQEDALRAGARPDGGGWGREPEEMWGRVVDDSGEHPVESEPGAWPTFYRQLVAALRGAGPVPVPPEAAVAVLEVIEAARHSGATNSVVSLDRLTRERRDDSP